MKILKILNTNLSNSYSISFALERLGYKVEFINNFQNVNNSELIIIPGVGHFQKAIDNLSQAINIHDIEKKNLKIFGICLGMQLLMSKSEEGDVNGLNLIDGEVESLIKNKIYTVPNIGWKQVRFKDKRLSKFNDEYFYFVHSYAAFPKNSKNVLGEITLENKIIPVVISEEHHEIGNYFGCQFHPEKSGEIGLSFLEAILSIMNNDG